MGISISQYLKKTAVLPIISIWIPLGGKMARREFYRLLVFVVDSDQKSERTICRWMESAGYRAEALPFSTRDDVRLGRQYTSGKECVPMILTLGTMLNRVQREPDPAEQFTLFMPTARGPCRFGVYNAMHKIALERAGLADRVTVVSLDDKDYFCDLPVEFTVRLWLGFLTFDLLQAMRFELRPVETEPGAADRIHAGYLQELLDAMEHPGRRARVGVVRELLGQMWGMRRILIRAAHDYAAIRDGSRRPPTVAVVGEIYARLDPFANDHIVEKLEARGIRARLAPFVEWLEYTTHLAELRVLQGRQLPTDVPLSIGLTGLLQRVSSEALHRICAEALGWGPRTSVAATLSAALPYLHPDLRGEAVLTLGGPLHEFAEGLIDGVVIVGPHECMPCKIGEAQYGLAAERLGIPYLSIPVSGDPLDTEVLDRFAYDIRRAARRRAERVPASVFPVLAPRDNPPESKGEPSRVVVPAPERHPGAQA